MTGGTLPSGSAPIVGVIRVVTLEDRREIEAHAELIAGHLRGAAFVSRCIPGQESGVHDAESFTAAVPKVLALGIALAAECDALVVSCVDDPGVAELREAVAIPVIGAGSALAARVPQTGRAALLNLNDDIPEPLRSADRDDAQVFPDGGATTLELWDPEVRAGYLSGARSALAEGASALIAVCTGMDAAGLVPELEAALGHRVESPLAAVAVALHRALPQTTLTTHEGETR